MLTRAIYRICVAVLGIIAAFVLGHQGLAVLALYALEPFFPDKSDKKETGAERKKTITNSLVLFLGILVPLYVISDFKINGYRILDLWLELVTFSLLMATGIIQAINSKKRLL